MSGPTTVILTGNAAPLLLAAAAIRAAQAVAQAHAQADALRQSHRDQDQQRWRAMQDAAQRGQQAARTEQTACEAEFEQLRQLADSLGLSREVLGTYPAAPDPSHAQAVADYVQALSHLNADLRAILLTESARQCQNASFSEPDFSAAAAAAQAQRLAARLLARIAHLGPVPSGMSALARELDETPPGARADLLATELRAQIQAYAETEQQRQVQAATAVVVGQTLQDLGYQVEEVSHTLFVQGGVVHFRRRDWGPYMVRMRVDANASTANFNVVRAVADGENERSALDHLAEDRWCAEFPALLRTLQARGLSLQVTRRLEAGELPVQLVDANNLPRFEDDEAQQLAQTLLTKRLP